MSKLEEVSHEMLVFLHPRVSFRVSGCPVASPCLWGKLENLTFSNVSKQVVILFTLYTLHCSLHTPHFTLDTPLHSSLHTPYFTLYTFHFTLLTLHSALHTPHFPLHAPHSTLYTPHFTLLGGGVVTLVVRVVMFYWLGFVRFRLCSASRFWSTYRDADVRSAGLNSFPGFISLLGAAATHCPGSRQTSSQACILCGCLYSMLFIVYVELEAWDLQHSRALIVCGHVNEGRVCLSLSLL